MDKYIELLYCGYEVFKILVKNYLNIELYFLFLRVEKVVGDVKMIFVDVVEYLMFKMGCGGVIICLQNFVCVFELVKEEVFLDDGNEGEMKQRLLMEEVEQLGKMKLV